MKNLLLLVGGAGLAAFAMIWKLRAMTRQEPVEELAHRLQNAWADHHTVA